MHNLLWWISIIYAAGFAATFTFNACLGPVTPGLALFRGIVWPVYWITGWPAGQTLPMD